jgi:23S rRNA pseudouridine2605 synthase
MDSPQASTPGFARSPRTRVPAPWQHRETATQRARRLQAEVLRMPIRLNRFIAQSGLCSRREADDYIQKGMVKVNGKVVTDFSTHVQFDRDLVTVNGRAVDPQKLVYILVNKPKNHLCTLHDPQGRRTVMDLVRNVTHERIFPVGRLDRNTTGVLLLTNDGDMAKKLTHPSYEIKKVYHVRLNKPIPLEHLDLITRGLELEDGPIQADLIDYQPGKDFNEVMIEIHSGRNRIVRRIFEHLGYEVEALDRVAVGPLTKKGLARGHHRFLTEKEVGFLYMMLGNRKPKPLTNK